MDILVTSVDDLSTLAVDVKNKADTTPKWASELRGNREIESRCNILLWIPNSC